MTVIAVVLTWAYLKSRVSGNGPEDITPLFPGDLVSISPDGKRIYFVRWTSAVPDPTIPRRLYVGSLNGTIQAVKVFPPNLYPDAVFPLSHTLGLMWCTDLAKPEETRTYYEAYLVRIKNNSLKKVTSLNFKDAVGELAMSSDGYRIFYIIQRDGAEGAIVEVDKRLRKSAVLVSGRGIGGWSLSVRSYAQKSEKLAYITQIRANPPRRFRLNVLDLKNRRSETLFEGGYMENVHWTPDEKLLVFAVPLRSKPPQWRHVAVNVKTKKQSALLNSDYPPSLWWLPGGKKVVMNKGGYVILRSLTLPEGHR